MRPNGWRSCCSCAGRAHRSPSRTSGRAEVDRVASQPARFENKWRRACSLTDRWRDSQDKPEACRILGFSSSVASVASKSGTVGVRCCFGRWRPIFTQISPTHSFRIGGDVLHHQSICGAPRLFVLMGEACAQHSPGALLEILPLNVEENNEADQACRVRHNSPCDVISLPWRCDIPLLALPDPAVAPSSSTQPSPLSCSTRRVSFSSVEHIVEIQRLTFIEICGDHRDANNPNYCAIALARDLRLSRFASTMMSRRPSRKQRMGTYFGRMKQHWRNKTLWSLNLESNAVGGRCSPESAFISSSASK